MQVVGLVRFASTFAAFMTRAFDFVRTVANSRASIGYRTRMPACRSARTVGPSQMALEDLAMMRAAHGSTGLYPCDAKQTARLVGLMVERQGISYIRTTRERTPILYVDKLDDFRVGGSPSYAAGAQTRGRGDRGAHHRPGGGGGRRDAIKVRVIDTAALVDALRTSEGLLCVVEDRWVEGGLGDAVLAALAERNVAGEIVRFRAPRGARMPGSGKPAEMLDAAGSRRSTSRTG